LLLKAGDGETLNHRKYDQRDSSPKALCFLEKWSQAGHWLVEAGRPGHSASSLTQVASAIPQDGLQFPFFLPNLSTPLLYPILQKSILVSFVTMDLIFTHVL
jgi:hypothetical protein